MVRHLGHSDVTDYMNLTAGVYTLNVKDSKGCRDTATVTLVNPTPISITATPATQLLCVLDIKQQAYRRL
jgi:hypothetical protein